MNSSSLQRNGSIEFLPRELEKTKKCSSSRSREQNKKPEEDETTEKKRHFGKSIHTHTHTIHTHINKSENDARNDDDF